ncbi:MAG: ferric reductase-like transmembrane domain-containing protein [Bacteroidales bacterium]
MIKATLDLLQFLSSNFSFLFSLVVYTVLAILLSKSIKKHSKVYYWVFGVISFAFIVPFVCRLCGVAFPINIGNIPLLGLSVNELSSAANFIHPVLVLIMFMGAFNARIPVVGRLMSIRKELSIIVGFPVLAHATKRVFASFPDGWQYFADNEAFMANPRVHSALGSGITSFVFVLGLVMTILFLVLWITSFDSVRKKMGYKKWKSVQKWSYALYAMLFIHSIGLSVGSMISDNARETAQSKAKVEQVAEGKATPTQGQQQGHGQPAQAQMQQGQQQGHGQPAQAQAAPSHGGRQKPFSFTEKVEISRGDKRVIHIIVLFLIYGSYLVLRIRKAKRDKAKRKS